MNKFVKKGLSIVLAAGLIASSFAGCAKINYVTGGAIKAIHEIKDGSWQKQEDPATDANADADPVVIDPFVAGTYGGVEFKSLEDVAKFYIEAYDYTKSLTAEYITDDGSKATYYKLLGSESLVPGSVMIDGKENSLINGIVPGIVSSLFKPNIYGLVPCYNRDPNLDNNLEDDKRKADHDFRTSMVLAEDILEANITDNNDGTITIVIQPKAGEMSTRGDDSAGRFFEVLGDISGVIKDIDVISFSQGDALDNVKVVYKGGTVKIKVDAKTKEILEADYDMVANIAVTHANVAVIKDKSASLIINYSNHYPATDEDTMAAKKFKKA